VAAAVAASVVHAQGVRSRMRPKVQGTAVSEAQAAELTLTLTPIAVRPIQTWVRTAGTLNPARTAVIAYVTGPDAALVKVDQRARAFPVEARSSMSQARVVRVSPEGGRVRVDVDLLATANAGSSNYVVEIVTDNGDFLSVPNEAIIEEGTSQVVYVARNGQYEPQTIRTGIQGELYTQILDGVRDGDQVVTFGSFFIDSEFKLKGGATQVQRQ
jgi:hypothetical protein